MAPHPHVRRVLSQPRERKRKENFLVSRRKEKKSTSFPAGPRLWSPVSHPPPHPCSASRAGLGPPTFTLFGKVGSRIATCPLLWHEFPPFHCGTHNTRGRDTAAAATPLRGAHQPSPQGLRWCNWGLPGASPSILSPSLRPRAQPRVRGIGGGAVDGRSGNRGTPMVPGSLPGRVATSRTAQLGD